MPRHLSALFLLGWLVAGPVAAAVVGLPEAKPETVGLDPSQLLQIDRAVGGAIERHEIPGAVVLVGRRGQIVHAAVLGSRSVVPTVEGMTRDTIFDMASLTKPIATASSILILLDQGKIDLHASASAYWPEFASEGKAAITVEQLLRHRSGLIADNALADYGDGPEKAWDRIAHLGLVGQPGAKFLYSDVNFEVLGKLVERISGQTLDEFARTHVFEPMGIDATFKPRNAERIAPTEPDGDTMLRGTVHDPRARALGGVAGHAGLFASADDVAVVAQTWLNGGVAPNGRRIFQASTVKRATDPGNDPRPAKTRAWLGHRHAVQRSQGCRIRPDQLRAHRVHRHERLDRPRLGDVRGLACQPAPPRREGEVAHQTPGRGGVARGGGDRRRETSRGGRAGGQLWDRRADPGQLRRAPRQASRAGDEPYGSNPVGNGDDRRPLSRSRCQARRPLQPRAWNPGTGRCRGGG